MNKQLKEKWIKELESGKIKQARARLKLDEDSMCCLGVLCNIIDPNRWDDQSGWGHNNGLFGIEGMRTRSTHTVPTNTCSAIHLKMKDARKLAVMNDTLKLSFKEIAKWIRENL